MWLKNHEIRIKKGTLPPERRGELEDVVAWRDRIAMSAGEGEDWSPELVPSGE